MEQTGVQKLARVLKVLVTVTVFCNLLALPLVPGMVYFGNFGSIARLWAYDIDSVTGHFLSAIWKVWKQEYTAVLTLFLLFCGSCTAVLLWQGRRVLDSILSQDTFSLKNAGNMRRAAVCCFLISAAALVRMAWSLFYFASPGPLFTYNALFVPIFLMGGLLCLVMSALFRQAAELKADHDLTI